jgi:3-phosphoshikimate 1-carboxyvinyltransferase
VIPRPLIARRAGPLAGSLRVSGDKSISHRALMLGAMAVGETAIRGLLDGDDVRRTAAALAAMGAEVGPPAAPGEPWRVAGRGVGGLAPPDCVIDMGNSGTGARLLAGLIAGCPISAVLTGDASLVNRPMLRVTEPLERMGARFVARAGGRLPMTVIGAEAPIPIRYEMPVASAQVKSAILLAGLNAPGRTEVIEAAPTRDHTELMLRHFGAEVTVEDLADGGQRVAVTGEPELTAREVTVPADVSSAAFPLVAALICPGSAVTLTGVGVNPRRTGLIECLGEMGADIALDSARVEAGEPVADLAVRSAPLRGIEVPAERAPRMIDEYPILAMAAACAEGTSVFRGVGELRVKESDRLAAIADGLTACGVRVEADADSVAIHGLGRPPRGGAAIAAALDHRIAMSFLVLGLAAEEPIAVDDAATIDTSFPGFAEAMARLGAEVGSP